MMLELCLTKPIYAISIIILTPNFSHEKGSVN